MEANLFKNQYRTHTTRLENYDYSQGGYYFITICTDNKKLFFGNIKNGKMELNEIGEIVSNFYQQIPKHFSNIKIDKYVIMPNHIHDIIVINNSRDEAVPRLYQGKYPQLSKISPKAASLPVVIGSFKSICTKRINQSSPYINFKWQTGYYDHIIRNEQDYNNIWDYIDYNPDKWMWDRNNPDCIKKSRTFKCSAYLFS